MHYIRFFEESWWLQWSINDVIDRDSRVINAVLHPQQTLRDFWGNLMEMCNFKAPIWYVHYAARGSSAMITYDKIRLHIDYICAECSHSNLPLQTFEQIYPVYATKLTYAWIRIARYNRHCIVAINEKHCCFCIESFRCHYVDTIRRSSTGVHVMCGNKINSIKHDQLTSRYWTRTPNNGYHLHRNIVCNQSFQVND